MDSAVHRLPVLAETGIRKFYNGPESFTPDNQFLIGEAPELRRLLRRRRLQLGRASRRRAVRAGRSPSGSSRASPPSDLIGVDVRRFSPLAGNNAWLRAAGRRGARPALRRAVAQPRAGDRSPAAPLPGARPARAAGRLPRQPQRLGAGQRLCAPGVSAGRRLLLGAPVVGRLVGRGAASPPARRSRSSTRRPSRSTSSSGPDAESALQWLCTADVDVPVGRDGLHRHAQPPRHLRGRRHRDPDRRRPSTSSSAARPRPCATSTGSAATCRADAARTSST